MMRIIEQGDTDKSRREKKDRKFFIKCDGGKYLPKIGKNIPKHLVHQKQIRRGRWQVCRFCHGEMNEQN